METGTNKTCLNNIITEKDQTIETLRQENDSLKDSNDLLREKVAELEAEKEHLRKEALTQAQILSLLKDIHKTQHEESSRPAKEDRS